MLEKYKKDCADSKNDDAASKKALEALKKSFEDL